MLIRLGSLLAQVDGAADLFPIGDPRVGSFLAQGEKDGRPDVVVQIEVCRDPAREFSGGTLTGWHPASDSDGFEVINSDWTGSFDVARRRVSVSLHGPWRGALDALFKTVVQVFALVCGKGLVLHASSIERDGAAYVFMGASGAGKSTVALLTRSADKGEILSEEMTFVGLGLEGERPFVATLPFAQKNNVRVTSRTCPVAGMLALRQADRAAVTSFTRAQQVSAVVKASAIGVRDASLVSLALDAAMRLADEVPVKRLEFQRSPEFWLAIEADAIGGGRAAAPSSDTVAADGRTVSLKEDETCS